MVEPTRGHDSYPPTINKRTFTCSEGQGYMFKGLLLWMIGIPLPLIILLLIFVL